MPHLIFSEITGVGELSSVQELIRSSIIATTLKITNTEIKTMSNNIMYKKSLEEPLVPIIGFYLLEMERICTIWKRFPAAHCLQLQAAADQLLQQQETNHIAMPQVSCTKQAKIFYFCFSKFPAQIPRKDHDVHGNLV